MAQGRIVAELGRAETPAEIAARKAESSRVYRSSQTFRNLIAALLVTLAVVAVIVLSGPRGTMDTAHGVDVESIAAQTQAAYQQTPVVPAVPESWRANAASVEGDQVPTWTIVYATGKDAGFLRVAQGFGADPAWEARLLSGAAADGSVTIDGIDWTRYRLGAPANAANITYAIGTGAGADRILIYGATDAHTAAVAAAGLSDQIRALRKDAQ